VAADLDAIAERLFSGVMAPLVLGGAILPGHAIGARAALALGEDRLPADRDLGLRVAAARVRRARRLAPVDTLPDPSAVDWALAAALHDVLQAANPVFDAPLRRRAATRILELAAVVIERVPFPATVAEALSRHAWLARAPEVTRTDTTVRWWTGSREFLGVDPPARLQAWPQLRRVDVVRTPHLLLELEPLAVDREALIESVAALLARTPLTDLATCTRTAPAFTWHPTVLNLVTTATGRTLAMRALARLAPAQADVVLGRATRGLLASGHRHVVGPALSLLADRAVVDAEHRLDSEGGARAIEPIDDEATARSQPHDVPPIDAGAIDIANARFARALGALVARRALKAGEGPWSDAQRLRLVKALARAAQSQAAREASALLERGPSATP
jgi:hypothetical protein